MDYMLPTVIKVSHILLVLGLEGLQLQVFLAELTSLPIGGFL